MSLPADPGRDAPDDRPWERPGAVRRDWAPHRGRLLSILGVLSLNLGVLSLFGVGLVVLSAPMALAAIGLGRPAWALARRDLQAMATNLMDPAGQVLTRDGLVCGRAGAVFGILALLTAAALLWAVPVLIPQPYRP
jgi:hypothetical protein